MNTIEIEMIDLLFWVLLALIIICGIISFFIIRQRLLEDLNRFKVELRSMLEAKETHYSSYVDEMFSEQEKAFLNTLHSEEERVNYIQFTISSHNINFFENNKLLQEKELEEIKQLPVKERYQVTMRLMEKLIMN